MRDENIPDVLYKYYPPERWENMFKNWTIRFTPPEEFNDPFEWLPSTVLEKENKSFIEALSIFFYFICIFIKKSYIKTFIMCLIGYFFPIPLSIFLFLFSCLFIYTTMTYSGFIKHIFNNLLIQTYRIIHGILCLSENKASILMWSHYSDSHRGFVVCLDTKNPFFYMKNSVFCQVKYVKNRPKHSLNDDYIKYIFLKSNTWRYEREWRYSSEIIYDEKFYYNDKYSGVTSLPRSTVVGIIFGESMEDSRIKEHCICIRSQPDCAHIKLQRARLHESLYELVIEDIASSFYEQ